MQTPGPRGPVLFVLTPCSPIQALTAPEASGPTPQLATQAHAAAAGGPATLAAWLLHCDSLQPHSKDASLERTAAVRAKLALSFECPLVVVGGTNGKGSTCAMLESIARQAGYHVGLYQKPELVRFEERCRVDRQAVQGDELVPHFAAVEAARGDIVLNRFEFSTLAIAHLLASRGLDLVILEVGMGGRYDAVNAFDADVSVITSVDLDHMEYLGPDRETIGFDKAHIFRRGCPAIVSDPMPPQSVLDMAKTLGADLWRVGRDFNQSGDRQQWAWAGRGRRYAGLGYPALRGANQLLNASAAIATFEALRQRLPVPVQAIRNGLAMVDLPGRFQIVPGQPTLVLDVAHNAQAVGALALNLDAMGFFPRTLAVFGAMSDKDIAGQLARMAPLVEHWYFCDLNTPRAAKAADLVALVAPGKGQAHGSAAEALAAAIAAADPVDRIVVFGSFYTVGAVLKQGLPRLAAPHVGS
jgi:dihydrofolate synthase / folylpolyglutamate synthase